MNILIIYIFYDFSQMGLNDLKITILVWKLVRVK